LSLTTASCGPAGPGVFHTPGPAELTVTRYEHAPRPRAGGRGHALATHACAVALVVEAGALTFEQNGAWRAVEGDLVLVPPGSAHRASADEGSRVRGVAFPLGTPLTADLTPLLAPFERVRRGATCVAPLGPRARPFTRALDELAGAPAAISSATPRGLLVQRAWLTLLLAEIEGVMAASPSAPVAASPDASTSTELVTAALGLVEQRALGPFSLADVARLLGRSPSHVAHAVKHGTGQSVGQWILRRRLDEARERLRLTDERVDIIAERVGYADPSHFVRLFRRAEGVSPAAYRRASRG
jgi:AraC-like DNA-binding protein/quercetin dioxygenase-like cupin family protein